MGDLLLPLLGGGVLLIISFIGLSLSTGALRLALRQRRLDRHGVDAQAEVIRHRESSRNRFFSYRFEVNGVAYTHEEAADDAPPAVGSAVVVRYLPDKPAHNAMAGDTPYNRIYRSINPLAMALIGVVFALVGIGGVALILGLGR
jgi:hypothetical protein